MRHQIDSLSGLGTFKRRPMKEFEREQIEDRGSPTGHLHRHLRPVFESTGARAPAVRRHDCRLLPAGKRQVKRRFPLANTYSGPTIVHLPDTRNR
jgi:hypothetical protein